MRRRWIHTGLAAISVLLLMSTSTTAANRHVTVPEAALAARAAMAYVGGRWATVVRHGAPGYAWQFHVLRKDGSVTDVVLDEQLELVDVGGSPAFATGNRSGATAQVASATPEPSRPSITPGGSPSQNECDRAAKAALDAIGGGRVIDVDFDRERGAMYEVEVIRKDGRSVDVLLDASFRVMDMSGERDAGEKALVQAR